MIFHCDLTGKRILVVEDDYLQAREVELALHEHGADVVGPFSNTADGLEQCARMTVDAAILDVHLGEENSFQLANELVRRAVPFIFLSGYDRNTLPERYRNIPYYLKPLAQGDISQAIGLALVSSVLKG